MVADWSAIFAGIAAFVSIIGLVYSVRQHRDNIRREFILWALEQMQSPSQRENRRYLWYLHRIENKEKKQKMIAGIKKGKGSTLKDYGKIREAFALFDHIGYFWARAGYGNMRDVKALFPQILTHMGNFAGLYRCHTKSDQIRAKATNITKSWLSKLKKVK